ncbi:MAG: L-threonylcarbamoyladenylate synthase [bacterium]
MDYSKVVFETEINEAAEVLRRGGLVAFPTETVYGLGADASNLKALARMFAAKGRPTSHPVIVHLAEVMMLPEWASEIPSAAVRLAERFWPGPMTLILPRAQGVLDAVTGGQDTVGLRVPNHPVALGLLKAFGGGVAAPSANRFGRLSPTSAEHVRMDLGILVDMILDGGACTVGVESTILDLSREHPVLLRPGAITIEMLTEVLGEPPLTKEAFSTRAPGTLKIHYAPKTPLKVVNSEELMSFVESLLSNGKHVAVMARRPLPEANPNLHWLIAPSDAKNYAHDLYANLRFLDLLGTDRIIVEEVSTDVDWQAIQDRLQRAEGNG